MSPGLTPRARLVLGALLVAMGPLLAGCTPGVAPPSVCAVCDEEMVDVAAQHGANVSVSHSEIHLHLQADGSARWTVTVELTGEDVEAFRSNETLRRRVVERRFQDNRGPAPSDPRNLTVRMDGRTLIVSFADRGFAGSHAGNVLLVDTFHHQDASNGAPPFRLRADRMVLHPPEGWVVLHQVAGAEARTDAVIWREGVHERTYVVVGPEDTPTRTAYGQVAVATDVAGWATAPIVGGSVVPVVLLVVALVAARRRVEGDGRRETAERAGRELLGSLTVTGLGLLAAGVGIVLWHAPVSGVIGSVLSSLSGPDAGSSLPAIVLFLGLLLVPPVIAFFATGLLADRRPALRWPPAIVVVATTPLEVLWLVLVAPDISGLIAVVVVVVAVLASVLGFITFTLGRRTALTLGWVPETAPPTRTMDSNEHAGE